MGSAQEKLLSLYQGDDEEAMNFWEAMELLKENGYWNGASGATLWKRRFDKPDPLDKVLIYETGNKKDARVNVVALKEWLERRCHRLHKRRSKQAS